tara:strand:- start:1120 stop:1620 length:501 start_codon:yes stop_codon:yes gene_type:complete
MKYKIINNFLDLDQFNKVRSYVLDKEFPWRRVDDMNWNEKGRLFFTHCFFTDSEITSPGFEPYIKPILKKLNSIAVIKARANMFVSKLFTKSDLHIDYETGGKTAIFFLNDCDGGTEIKINNKIKFIKAKANKILIFDMGVQHRAVTSKETPVRYIINLNYYEDKI